MFIFLFLFKFQHIKRYMKTPISNPSIAISKIGSKYWKAPVFKNGRKQIKPLLFVSFFKKLNILNGNRYSPHTAYPLLLNSYACMNFEK